tara:strand:- start:120 stop:1109 length:990 start_codon:yes stop_codon:yes gene_type:complete
MTFDSRFKQEFLEIVTEEQKQDIENNFINSDQENLHIEFLNKNIQDLKDSIPALDSETSIHNSILVSSVQAINKYLEEKLQEIIQNDTANNNFLTWHQDTQSGSNNQVTYPNPGDLVTTTIDNQTYSPAYQDAPPLEIVGSGANLKIKIPYQINFCYIDKDQETSRVEAVDPIDGPMPTEPDLRLSSASAPVTVDGDTRQMPGQRRPESDTDREFFDKVGSIQIFYMQPLYEVDPNSGGGNQGGNQNTTVILSEKKIVALSKDTDSTLNQLIEQAKSSYNLFEEMINGVEDFSGSYSDSVNNYEAIADSINRRDRFLLRNQIFREFLGI